MLNKLLGGLFESPHLSNILTLGRGGAGKTVGLTAFTKEIITYAPSSGLQFSSTDPQAMIEFLDAIHQKEQELKQGASKRSVEVRHMDFDVRRGSRTALRVRLTDPIGQTMTHIGRNATPEQRQRYDELLAVAHQTNALVCIVPCPPAETAPQQNHLALDIPILNAHLQHILERRPKGKPLVVAVGFSRTDTRFLSRESAAQELTEEVLRAALGPVVNTLRHADNVPEAAIFAFTSYGYGATDWNHQMQAPPPNVSPTGVARLEHEGPYQLTGPMRPDNLVEMYLWAVLAALVCQNCPAGRNNANLEEVVRFLHADFLDMNAWFVPLKGRLKPRPAA